MPVDVIIPKMEMSQEEATLVEWLKQEGDPVKKGEPLFVVETDKVTVEVEAPGSGVLARVTAQAGERLPVTTCIAYILAPGEEAPTSEPASQDSRRDNGQAPAVERIPGAPIPAEATPLARRMASAEGLDLRQIPGSGPGGKITRSDVEKMLSGGLEKPRATPAARRIARELDLPLTEIAGSGPRGRIQGEDVQRYQEQRAATQPAARPPEPEVTVVPVQGIRRSIAERMLASYQQVPHITFTSRVDLTHFEAARQGWNQRAERAGEPRASVTALLVKLVAQVLPRHPYLNARLVSGAQGDEIHLLKQVNIGVAVALPEGLIVPVVHDADRKPGRQIAAEVRELAEKARQSRLAPADVAGGTFTISNLGPFGIEQFTAIINPGQTGILAVGATVQEPYAVDGQVQLRPVVRLTLSVDHRVVDGARAAHFMADLREVLENPALGLW
jgi:pyruvate dehydrogenase E2 component (dihydrolipoamide acetyltransferase)